MILDVSHQSLVQVLMEMGLGKILPLVFYRDLHIKVSMLDQLKIKSKLTLDPILIQLSSRVFEIYLAVAELEFLIISPCASRC